MKCSRCQQENPPHAKFCLECAAPLARSCSKCGAELPTAARFCIECAHPVGSPTSRVASPESYTPKHLAERILTSKAALEGERKQVTVLFADLKGSMELLADRDPEEARKLLDPVLEHMMEAVHRYEGTVNQVMGDGIMALFGAPLAHEDHAVRACYAALRMQEAVKRYAEGMRREEGVTIRIRVGLNSGEVVVRAIGSDLHMDYTAVGQTTHLAARMEQLAEPGTALLTSATLALCEDFVQAKSLGPMRIKGLNDAVQVYELADASPVRSRFQAHAARGLTKFVGRTSEMAQLSEALDLARGGRGQIVAGGGEPGVGKSRLFWEFAHSHRSDGCLVLEAASVSYGEATTYLAVIELLRSYLQIEPHDDLRKIREKVTGKLVSLDRALEPALPAVLALLDVPIVDDEWARLDPPQRRQRTLDAVKRLLLRESQVQPLVVIFEDLHWIDGETQAMLDGLVESLPTARILMLVNYRPEYQHAWGSKTFYRQLRVDPLPAEGAAELLGSLLGADPSLRPLKRTLIERTEGNPFFLEESVRTLVETKVLAGEGGAYRLTRAPENLQIPATAQAILAARIDRLEPDDKRLLQAASVIGKDVPLALLQSIADASDDKLRLGLGRLQAAEFLYEAKLFPEIEYTFKHALTHEVAYGSLLHERRRYLHEAIASAMERVFGDRVSEHTERIGDHAFRGEDWERAVRHLKLAGAKALSGAAFHEAALQFDRVLQALGHLSDAPAMAERRIDARFNLHDALLPLGEYDRLLAVVREAEVLAETLGDQRRLGRAYSYLSHHAWIALGDNEAAADYARRTLRIARVTGDMPLETVANFFLGQVAYSRGELPTALEAFERNASALPLRSLRRPFEAFYAILSRGWAGFPYSELGAFDEGFARCREALEAAETTANPVHFWGVCLGLGRLHLARGEFRDAAAVVGRALTLREVGDVPQWFPLLASTRGSALVWQGQFDEGLSLLQATIEVYERRKTAGYLLLWMLALGEGYLLSGRIENAVEQTRRVLGIARRRRERAFEARGLCLLGGILSTSASEAAAFSHYREAIGIGNELGMRPLVAHCHLGLGKLYRRAGKRQEAQEHFTTAMTMYREMGMTYWLEQAETQMAEQA